MGEQKGQHQIILNYCPSKKLDIFACSVSIFNINNLSQQNMKH